MNFLADPESQQRQQARERERERVNSQLERDKRIAQRCCKPNGGHRSGRHKRARSLPLSASLLLSISVPVALTLTMARKSCCSLVALIKFKYFITEKLPGGSNCTAATAAASEKGAEMLALREPVFVFVCTRVCVCECRQLKNTVMWVYFSLFAQRCNFFRLPFPPSS